MSTPTPGPWTYGRDGVSWCWFVPEPPEAETPHGLGLMLEADARLIAAAPELLAALKRADGFITNGIALGFIRMPDADVPDPAKEVPGIVRVAIAKAEGQS